MLCGPIKTRHMSHLPVAAASQSNSELEYVTRNLVVEVGLDRRVSFQRWQPCLGSCTVLLRCRPDHYSPPHHQMSHVDVSQRQSQRRKWIDFWWVCRKEASPTANFGCRSLSFHFDPFERRVDEMGSLMRFTISENKHQSLKVWLRWESNALHCF